MLPHGLHDVEVLGHDLAVEGCEVVHQFEVQHPGLVRQRQRRIAVDRAGENVYWAVLIRV